jgi:hypothetical protein
MTTLAQLSLSINVTPANYRQVLEGVKTLLETGAVFSVNATEPAPEPEPAPVNGDAPKATRRASRKAAEPAPPANDADETELNPEPTPPVEPGAETADTASAAPEDWNPQPEPADAPLTVDDMTDKLNAFAKIHGVAATRKTIQSFGVTRLSELEQVRWPELLAKLNAENGGKPV